jgi:peroxiredoxin
MTAQLKTGDRLPPLMAKSLDGEDVDMTARVAGNWAVILFYRGDW